MVPILPPGEDELLHTGPGARTVGACTMVDFQHRLRTNTLGEDELLHTGPEGGPPGAIVDPWRTGAYRHRLELDTHYLSQNFPFAWGVGHDPPGQCETQ